MVVMTEQFAVATGILPGANEVYTVARYKLVVFVWSDWREQLKRCRLSLWKVFSDAGLG